MPGCQMKMAKSVRLLLPCVLAAGCAARSDVEISGFAISGQSLGLPAVSTIGVVEDSNATNRSLEKEIAVKIQKLLGTKGFSTAGAEPDYYLLFSYGIDSGRTAVETRAGYEPGDIVTVNVAGTCSGKPYSRISTIHAPPYTTYVPYSATVYTRWLVLRLIDGRAYRKAKEIVPVWIGEITSVGAGSDLRETINYMLVAAFEHFGENTGKRISNPILKRDERVRALMAN